MSRPRVSIVGASAAGLAAAIAASRAGADVTLHERKAAIGVPAAHAIIGFDLLWPATIARPSHTVLRRLPGVHLRASDGRGPLVDAPLSLFDRVAFDQYLAAEAEREGARLEMASVPDVDALLKQGDTVIFADGAKSQATRFLRPTRDPAALAWGAVLDVEAPGDHDHLLLTLGPHAPGGRSQLNPLGGERWSHWTFFRGDPAQAESMARGAFALDARLMGWKDARVSFTGVAPDPVYTIPRDLVRGQVMVAGGAAGQGGLEVGLAAGWMAGDAAARGKPRLYERAWRARYQKGYERLRRATDTAARLDDMETRAMLAPLDGVRLSLPLRARRFLTRPRAAVALARAGWQGWARA